MRYTTNVTRMLDLTEVKSDRNLVDVAMAEMHLTVSIQNSDSLGSLIPPANDFTRPFFKLAIMSHFLIIHLALLISLTLPIHHLILIIDHYHSITNPLLHAAYP